jgi:arylsulfatase A-like enzyme
MTSVQRQGRIVVRLGVLGAGVLTLAALAASGCARPSGRPNVVLISLDTTRRDHLSLYGYPRLTTPRLERFAAGSLVFERAVAQLTLTSPSHASIFTGLYPHSHGVGANARRLRDDKVTLAEVLHAAGYRTGAFVSGFPLRADMTGIDQGFDQYDSEFVRRRKGRETVDRALRWLAAQQESKGSFLLFLHLYDAHGPYRPPPEYLQQFVSSDRGPLLGFMPGYQRIRDGAGRVLDHAADYVDRYDALLRYQDDLVGDLLDRLDLDHTVVAIVADHGETLVERETRLHLNHGTSVFEEQIGIPMLLRAPGLAAGRVAWTAETVDLFPTLLDLVGLRAPAEVKVEGHDLAPRLRGEEPPDRRDFAFASSPSSPKQYVERGYDLRRHDYIHTVRNERWKLIRYPGTKSDYLELYDLLADPSETRNLADGEVRVRNGLAAALDSWTGKPIDSEPPTELAPEDLKQLRALGYIDN